MCPSSQINTCFGNEQPFNKHGKCSMGIDSFHADSKPEFISARQMLSQLSTKKSNKKKKRKDAKNRDKSTQITDMPPGGQNLHWITVVESTFLT